MENAAVPPPPTSAEPGPWRGAISALVALLIGIGLARFAYTPLLPALVERGWFTGSEAAYLGAANLAGYLAGALLAGRLAAQFSAPLVLRSMMLLASLSLLACASPLAFVWFFAWRLAAGIAGGVLMALAAPSVLPRVPSARRGLAGGVIFTGVGLGIAISGTLVPMLLEAGLFWTWIALGLLAAALTVVGWGGWPDTTRRRVRQAGEVATAGFRSERALLAVYLAYGLNAVGLVPHMVFLVNFVARGLGQGVPAGAFHWVLFGAGALVGPVLAGRIADRIGAAPALRLGFLVQAAAIGLPWLSAGTLALHVSSLVVGASVPGCVILILGRVRELASPDTGGQAIAWGRATAAFAIGQAIAAYVFSWMFEQSGDHVALFGLGALALLVALAIEWTGTRRR